MPPAAKNPFINGLKKLAKKTIFFEMVPRKNDICLTVNRLGSPTPFINGLKKLAKKTIFFEMVLRKNDICLTVNRLGSPTPF